MSIKSLVSSALNAAHAYGTAISGLKALPEVKAAQAKGRDALRDLLLPHVATFYKVPLVTSESNRNKGQQVLDREHASFEAASRALKRLTADLMGEQAPKVDVEVPAELFAAAAKLAKLASEYEGARSLASKALAAAFAA